MQSRFALIRAMGVSVLAVVCAFGCEAIVGNSPPGDIECVEAPGACPEGQSCISGKCTACSGAACQVTDGGHEVGTMDGPAPPPMDSGHDAINMMEGGADARDSGHEAEAASLLALGSACTTGPQCASGVCGDDQLIVGVPMVESGSVCTKPCCTSADCTDTRVSGFICYPSVGGNYCIDPAWISLPAPGAGLPGASCTSGGACRSSVCKDMACQDTCCLGSNCGGGENTCQLSTLDGQENFNCGAPGGSGAQGADCEFSSCQSNLCVEDSVTDDVYCYGACCQDSDCMEIEGNPASCSWQEVGGLDSGTAWLRACTEPVHPGKAAYQAACSSNADCASGLCNGGTACTKPCCASTSCGTWTCSYSAFDSDAGGNVDLQVCVP